MRLIASFYGMLAHPSLIHIRRPKLRRLPKQDPPGCEQAAGLTKLTGKGGCRVFTRDSDTKFGKAFDGALRDTGVTPLRLPHRAPNLNAHMERFIQTIQNECTDRFIVTGTGHLDHLVGENLKHSNTERPHSGIRHRTPGIGDKPLRLHGAKGAVRCRTRLGGVLRSYYRAAG